MDPAARKVRHEVWAEWNDQHLCEIYVSLRPKRVRVCTLRRRDLVEEPQGDAKGLYREFEAWNATRF